MSCEHPTHQLDAYVDGELDAGAATDLRERLRHCAGCRRHVAEREALSRLIRRVPSHAAPERLRTRIMSRAARLRLLRRVGLWASAAVLLLAVGASAVMLLSRSSGDEAITGEVVDNHVRSLLADHLFDVQSTDQHTVKPWFLGKLSFAPPVLDLSAAGFTLVGGRLDYLQGRPVAALVYRYRLHTINVLVSGDDRGAVRAPGSRTVRGFNVYYWPRGGLSFWAVSDMDKVELQSFVRALQEW